MKHKLWHILLWIDYHINHQYFEKLFNNYDSDFGNFIWIHTSRKFCNFVFDHTDWDTDRETFQEFLEKNI